MNAEPLVVTFKFKRTFLEGILVFVEDGIANLRRKFREVTTPCYERS
jgi:hypothetical protein